MFGLGSLVAQNYKVNVFKKFFNKKNALFDCTCIISYRFRAEAVK